ncbi:hypothetical protein [Streptomyces sp. KL116D]|uniref:effector-associated domain 2-containing protein n=1 Tax=Streptomyces sp. KL116D TaxID=3045152 RepID=UPI003558FDBD
MPSCPDYLIRRPCTTRSRHGLQTFGRLAALGNIRDHAAEPQPHRGRRRPCPRRGQYLPLGRAVEALLAYPLIHDPSDRRLVIGMLDPRIVAALPRNPAPRLDVTNIVSRIMRHHPEALDDLY